MYDEPLYDEVMMDLDYDQAIRMARWMKQQDSKIQRAIRRCEKNQHGVVALRFSNECRAMDIEILDEPYEGNVRVYPG